MLFFLQKRDVFVILPTGFGKSLCFGCLPSVFDCLKGKGSIVIVISPLIALMKDQVEGFQRRGVSAVRVGDCSPEISKQIRSREYQLVFVSREAILSIRKWLLSEVYQRNLVALVIDKAHCVKKWYVLKIILYQSGIIREYDSTLYVGMALKTDYQHLLDGQRLSLR